MTEAGARGTIVVGVDGSPASKAALAWAIDEAQRHDWAITAVVAWSFPSVGFSGFGGTVMPVVTAEDLKAEADRAVRDTVLEVAGPEPVVPITVEVHAGAAAPVLIDASRFADLLVVGSEGHGAFAGMLLGSVSAHVVRHAVCPVTVVRPPAPAAAA